MLTLGTTAALLLAMMVTGSCAYEGLLTAYIDEPQEQRGSGSLWKPQGQESRADWLATYGMKKEVYEETLALVKKCKVTKVDQQKMDIFLSGSVPTLERARECVDRCRRRHKRSMINHETFPTRKWTMPIIYKFDNKHDPESKLMVEAAIRHWESETCIRFKQVDTNDNITVQHILFQSGHTCQSSGIGRLPKSIDFPLKIILFPRGCTMWLGIPVHEIGHLIGFAHEHARPDRDDYVKVDEKNIRYDYLPSYYKFNSSVINTMNIPYDYGSVMHYSTSEFPIVANGAIVPINPLYLHTMGQRVGLSFFDAKHANFAYCKDKCAGVKPHVRCYNRGYRDPNGCSRCKCPEGFGRRQCRDPARVHGGCSPTSFGTIKVRSTTEKCLFIRNYGKGPYRHGDKCNWLLKARAGRKIEIRFAGPTFSTYCNYDAPTCLQWVEIKFLKDLTIRGPRFCCNPSQNPKFNGKESLTSESNKMLVVFNAEFPLFTNKYSTVIPVHYMKGFKLCYKLASR